MVASALFPSSFSRGLAAKPGCTLASEPVARRFSSDRASPTKASAHTERQARIAADIEKLQAEIDSI